MKKIPEKKYKMIMEEIPILCVDLVIKRKNKVLLVKRKNKPLKNFWWIPGGRVQKRETLTEAVKRKAKEELNLKIKKIKHIGFYEYLGDDSFFENMKTGVHTVSIVFLVSGNTEELKVDRDHEAFQWVEIKKFPKELKRMFNRLNL